MERGRVCTAARRSRGRVSDEWHWDWGSEGMGCGGGRRMGRHAGRGSGEEGERDQQEMKVEKQFAGRRREPCVKTLDLGPELGECSRVWPAPNTGLGWCRRKRTGHGHPYPIWAPVFPALDCKKPGARGQNSRQSGLRRGHATWFIRSPLRSCIIHVAGPIRATFLP